MSKGVFPWVAALLAFALLMVSTAVPISAFDARSGATVTVAAGEVVDDDLYAAGGIVTIDGTVNGDVWALGRTITVNGVVKGSVMAGGEEVDISGDVGRTVRVVGKTLNIRGNVQGDVLAGGRTVNLTSPATILGDFLLGAGNASIGGLVGGDIQGGGGDVTLSNRVKGNVALGVGGLTLLPTANIQGNLTYTSGEEADIHAGAQIGGAITHNLPKAKEKRAKPFPFSLFSRVTGKVIGFLMALLAGLIIILLAPRPLTSMSESIRTRPGQSAGWGAIILFATPVAAIIVCITVIGVPVALIVLAVYGMAIYLSQIPVGLFIGRWIIRRRRGFEGKAITFGALALGLVILRLLRLIPYLGFLITLAIILFGLGAIVAAGRRSRTETREMTSA